MWNQAWMSWWTVAAAIPLLLANVACSGRWDVARFDHTYISKDEMVRDVLKVIPDRDFSRANLTAEVQEFYRSSRRQKFKLQRLTIAPENEALFSLLWSDICQVGLPLRAELYAEATHVAQVVLFQDAATAWIKTGGQVEMVQLSNGNQNAAVIEVERYRYTLASFRIRVTGEGKDKVVFWVSGGALTQDVARKLLDRLLILTGVAQASVIVRRDPYFGTTGGPVFDVLRAQATEYAPPKDGVSYIDCGNSMGAVGCVLGTDECRAPATGQPFAY